MQLRLPDRILDLTTPAVMGVLNVTPDSFSDGGRFDTVERALAQARRLAAEGAAFVDVGGESTRPGAVPVSEQEEVERVVPVIEAIRGEIDVAVSVDTSKPAVMEAAVRAGAGLINDVAALRYEGALETAARCGVPVCLMHMQGEPRTMQKEPRYRDVVHDVGRFLAERVDTCTAAGISRDRLVLDPGFGFGKTLEHNLQLLARIDELMTADLPLLVGMSRKSMIGTVTGRPVEQRLAGGLAAATLAASAGAAIIRTHDVAATVDAMKVVAAVRAARVQGDKV